MGIFGCIDVADPPRASLQTPASASQALYYDDEESYMGCDNCKEANAVMYCTMCVSFFCDGCRGMHAESVKSVCERCEPVVGADTACLICRESVKDTPALRCSQCPFKPIHQTCDKLARQQCMPTVLGSARRRLRDTHHMIAYQAQSSSRIL